MTTCDRPSTGWRCTRAAGHDGPCAAVPTAPVPPLTVAALPDAETWEEHVARGECTCDRLCKWRCALHGSPDYKSHEPCCGCSGCYASNKEHSSRLKAEAELKPRIADLESELAQLRTELAEFRSINRVMAAGVAEREQLESRRDALLCTKHAIELHGASSNGLRAYHHVAFRAEGVGAELLGDYLGKGGTGPTYEAALAAALDKLE